MDEIRNQIADDSKHPFALQPQQSCVVAVLVAVVVVVAVPGVMTAADVAAAAAVVVAATFVIVVELLDEWSWEDWVVQFWREQWEEVLW